MRANSTNCFSEHSIFLSENGDLMAYGSNGEGQCGIGNTEDVLTPTKIMNNPKIKSIVLGSYNSFYLEKNGDLYTFGRNLSFEKTSEQFFTVPTKIETNVKKVCASLFFSIIQKRDNTFIILGESENEIKGGEFKMENVKDFSCGRDHIVFLKENGEVWVMGSNSDGQCGLDHSTITFSEPTLMTTDPNIFSVTCGKTSTYLLTKEDNSTVIKYCGLIESNRSEFVPQSTLAKDQMFKNVRSIHCGGNNVLLLLESGEVYGYGANSNGELGLNKTGRVSQFTKCDLLIDIKFISTGWNFTYFVNKKEEVFVCGNNENGKLGIGSNSEKILIPTKLPFNNDIMLIQNNSLIEIWSPSEHVNFPSAFKARVYTFLLFLKRISSSNSHLKIPKPVLFLIIGNL